MRQGSNNGRRPRGRPQRKQHGGGAPRHGNFDSSGPEGRIRGNAHQVYEKYIGLARDATSMGDRIAAETYYQYAEHYYRIVNVRADPKPNSDGQSQGQDQGQSSRRGGNGLAEAPVGAAVGGAVEAAPQVAEEQPDLAPAPVNGEQPQEARPTPDAEDRPAPPRRRRPRQAKAAEPQPDPKADPKPNPKAESKPDPQPEAQASPVVQPRKDGDSAET